MREREKQLREGMRKNEREGWNEREKQLREEEEGRRNS